MVTVAAMGQLPASAVTLRRLAVAEPDEAPRCELMLPGLGAATPPLAGAVLEAAFRTAAGGWLLFLTDDVPHEEALHIHLLEAGGALLDSATLSWPYATGSFELLALEAPHSVRFRFFGDTDWTVQVLPAPALRLPLISEPRGVHRKPGFSRHFRIDGSPKPERG